MKKIFLTGALLAPAAAMALIATPITTLKNAEVNICGARVEGCASYIQEVGTQQNLLLDTNYAQEFLDKHLQGMGENRKVMIRETSGIMVVETGHYPNPTAEFRVFKPLKILE